MTHCTCAPGSHYLGDPGDLATLVPPATPTETAAPVAYLPSEIWRGDAVWHLREGGMVRAEPSGAIHLTNIAPAITDLQNARELGVVMTAAADWVAAATR